VLSDPRNPSISARRREVVVELVDLKGRAKLARYPLTSLVEFEGE